MAYKQHPFFFFLIVLEAGKFKILALANSVSSESSLSGSQMAAFFLVEGVRSLSGIFFLSKGTDAIHYRKPLWPNHLPKVPLPNTIISG